MTSLDGALTSKLVHFAMIVLIAVYVVFVKKPCSTVESVSHPPR